MMLLFIAVLSTSPLWLLREGRPPEAPVTSIYVSALPGACAAMDAHEMRTRLTAGDESMVCHLAAKLVSEGRSSEALLYWKNSSDPPATRDELLSSLAWYGRHVLYRVMRQGGSIPEDLRDRMHGHSYIAMEHMGWMKARNDGLFHGGSLVKRGDLALLAGSFPSIEENMAFLPVSYLDTAFRDPPGGGYE
jgi:hypothetical protein